MTARTPSSQAPRSWPSRFIGVRLSPSPRKPLSRHAGEGSSAASLLFVCLPAALVLVALADVADIGLGDELGLGVEIGRRDAAIDLQVELHDRIEALQEGL